MFPNITKLQNRFFICYLLAVFIPIMLLSSMIYSYHSRQRTKDYITGKKNSLIIEQNYLESQLNSSSNYFNQLKSNYELQSLLKGIYASEREIATVYKGNIIKNLIMDCQSYTKYRPNETTGGIFVSWRRKEELPTGA